MATAVLIESPNGWRVASELQQRYTQHSRPEIRGLNYSAECRQMHEVGGDFCDFWPLENGRSAIAIGDASGKGVAAALMISNVQCSLRTASLFAAADGAAALQAVNRQLFESSPADRYATVFYGMFDKATRVLRYVNAGHNAPMVIRQDKSTLWLETGGAPAGMFPDWKYEQGSVELRPGDIVIAYTDGVVEATNPEGDEWGVEGLCRAASACQSEDAGRIVRNIFAALDKHTRGVLSDDASIAVLRVLD